jgi:hypothetical protein
MKAKTPIRNASIGFAAAAAFALLAAGCASDPHDYSLYRANMPKSILVLPPLNESVDVMASYSFLSTVSRPLGDIGYYVFPVAVVDAYMKDNGLPNPGEMHQVSIAKLGEVFGADAVLYVTIEEWGQEYIVLQSTTIVRAKVGLVDVKSAALLWEGRVDIAEGSGGGGLIESVVMAAIDQIVDSVSDRTHEVSRMGIRTMAFDSKHGLLYGPRHPKFGEDARGAESP